MHDTEQTRIHHAAGTDHALRDFYPLAGMLVLVLTATVLSIYQLSLDPMLAFMGWFFLVFGALKTLRLSGFVEAYRMYDLVAMRSRAYAYAYPFLEIAFGLAYLAAWQVKPVSVLVLIVMLIGALGVYRKLRAREEIPCACLGTVFTVPMTYVTLGEDLLMAAMALLILVG